MVVLYHFPGYTDGCISAGTGKSKILDMLERIKEDTLYGKNPTVKITATSAV